MTTLPHCKKIHPYRVIQDWLTVPVPDKHSPSLTVADKHSPRQAQSQSDSRRQAQSQTRLRVLDKHSGYHLHVAFVFWQKLQKQTIYLVHLSSFSRKTHIHVSGGTQFSQIMADMTNTLIFTSSLNVINFHSLKLAVRLLAAS